MKGWHGFIVLPAAIHPETGNRYEFLPGKVLRSLGELPPFDPRWVQEIRREPVCEPNVRGTERTECREIRDLRAYIRSIPSIEGQNGSNACFRVACLLYDAGLDCIEALQELEAWNEVCAFPMWSREELIKKIADVWKRKRQDAAIAEEVLSRRDHSSVG